MSDLPPDPLFQLIGLKTSVLIASVVGGLVSAMISGGSILERTTKAVVGCLTSIYATPIAIEILVPWFPAIQRGQLEHAAAFICGLLGMSIAQGVYRWSDRIRNNPFDMLGGGKPPPTK